MQGSLLFAQNNFLKGFVRDNTKMGIRRASIENLNSNKGTFSNELGAFTLSASIGDSLRISHIGYQTRFLVLQKSHFESRLILDLTPLSYPLSELKVRKKSDSLALHFAKKIKSDSLLNNFKRYTQFPAKPKLEFSNGLVLEGLITAIWYKLSDKGKEMEKLKRIQSLYQTEMRADDKLNLQFIQSLCACSPDSAAQIKKLCRPPAAFVLQRNDYDIALFIKKCLQSQGLSPQNSQGLPEFKQPVLSPKQ